MTTAAPARPRPSSIASTARGLAGKLTLPLILLTPILLFAPFFNEPFEVDEGAYATIAQGILHHGLLPYRDLFDHKPPLVYGWYALSFLLFGESIVAPRILAALTWSATTLLLYLEARLLFSRRQALLAAGIFAVSSGAMAMTANANTEVFTLLPLTACLLAFTRWLQGKELRWLFIAGVCGALAALTKQVAVWNLLALAVSLAVPLLRRREFHKLALAFASMGAGVIVVFGVVLIPWLVTNSIDDFFYATVTYNRIYSSNLTFLERLSFTWYGLEAFVLMLAPLLVLTLMALWTMARRRRTQEDYLLALSFAGALAGVMTSGYYLRHYFVVLLPFMALLAGPMLDRVLNSGKAGGLRITTAISLLMAVFLAVNLPAYLASSPEARHAAKFSQPQAGRDSDSHLLADYIAARTTADQPIYDFGRSTHVYFYANRAPAISYMYDRPFFLEKNTLASALNQLEAVRPVYILDTEPGKAGEDYAEYHPQAFMTFLASHYDFVGHVYFADLYRLKQAG